MKALQTLTLLAASTVLVAGCATSRPKRATATVSRPTLTACEESKDLPPTLIGSARTGEGQQPVLVMGCGK